jgi:hypothetical protein
MDREVALHLLSELERLQSRVEHLEVHMQVNLPNLFKKEVSQSNLLALCQKYDAKAEMTDKHTVGFELASGQYTATLNEARTEILVRSPDGRGSKFDAINKMDRWLAAQKEFKSGGISTRPPEGSRLMAYTQAVLAQQGREAL